MANDDPNRFPGFVSLEQNWFRVPNILADEWLCTLSKGEILVLLYIIRCTIGYKDESKRISLDEFQYGRTRSNGDPLDTGTGLSRPTIIIAIRNLLDRGFICKHTDGSDRARVKNYYSLRMQSDEHVDDDNTKIDPSAEEFRGKENKLQGLKNFTPVVKKSYTDHRNTLNRNTLNKRVPTSSKCGTVCSSFDQKAAKYLRTTLDKVGIKTNNRDQSKWANQFRLLRTYDKASEDDIRSVLKWYRSYYSVRKGTAYTIVVHSARAFREKFFDKLLPAASAEARVQNSVVNGIKEITTYDVERAHRRDPDWGSTYLFIDFEDWDLQAYRDDRKRCYRSMADMVNERRLDNPGLVRTCLQRVGLDDLVLDEN